MKSLNMYIEGLDAAAWEARVTEEYYAKKKWNPLQPVFSISKFTIESMEFRSWLLLLLK